MLIKYAQHQAAGEKDTKELLPMYEEKRSTGNSTRGHNRQPTTKERRRG